MEAEIDGIKMKVIKRQAEFCKALSEPKRLQIIQELRRGEMPVSKLAGTVGLKQSNASQHLAVLRRIGLISPRKEGNIVYYSLANPKIIEACDLVHEIIAAQLRNEQALANQLQHLK